jgi:dienelactone hydrolase
LPYRAPLRRDGPPAVALHPATLQRAWLSEFDRPWPPGVPLQIHIMDADEWALPPNEDLDVARRLDETVESAELFVYPGDRHLFADTSLPDYDEGAATLLKRRVLSFLDDIE